MSGLHEDLPVVWLATDSLWCGGSERLTVDLANVFGQVADTHLCCMLGCDGLMARQLRGPLSIIEASNMNEAVTASVKKVGEVHPDYFLINNSIGALTVVDLMRSSIGRVGAWIHNDTRWYDQFIEKQHLIDAFFVVNDRIGQHLINQGVAAGKVFPVPNLVDDYRFSLVNPDQRAMSRKWVFAGAVFDDTVVLGYVGRVSHEKGPHRLVEAYRRLRDTHNLALVLVGGPDGSIRSTDISALYHANSRSEEDLLRQALAACGDDLRVTWTGRAMGDVRPWLGAMDALVFSSKYEGEPYAALEAASMGVPSILPSSCGEIAAAGGGLTYEHRRPGQLPDLDDLCSGIERFCGLSSAGRTRMRFAARKLIETHHSTRTIEDLTRYLFACMRSSDAVASDESEAGGAMRVLVICSVPQDVEQAAEAACRMLWGEATAPEGSRVDVIPLGGDYDENDYDVVINREE